LADFSTPESAIQSLESAYQAHDVEAAVACKDFRAEAELMLQNVNPQFADDKEIISQTAEVLELSYRKDIEQNGFPDFAGVKSSFPKTERLNNQLVIVTEVCEYPDGVTMVQRLNVYKTAAGWRVLNALNDEPNRTKKWWQFWR
jgi:hypothetical protein